MTIITEKTYNVIEKDNRYLSKTTRIPYFPLVVSEAKGSIVKDIEGNEFIDFLSSAAVVNTGHNHPRIVAAIEKQLKKFIHYTPAYLYHEPHVELAELITSITPGSFDKRVGFGLSGSSSIEGAIKAARSYTKRTKIISFFRSYHGTTIGALSVSGYCTSMKRGLGPLMPDVYFINYPDSYRSKGSTEDYIKQLEELFETILPPDEVAAIIFEPIQGDAGILIPSREFYDKLQDLCRKHGILTIVDEIQTGFGRTGKMFASEHFNLEPDILVFGKAVASGMPLSGLVARKEILESWGPPAHFFNTAGNPISCQAAIETVKIIQEEGLIENANIQGNYIMDRFRVMMDRFECIGDVRGEGLLIGVDIVIDRISKVRNTKAVAKICWRCWEKGLILAFFSESVLRVAPPLVLTREEAVKAMDIIEEAIDDVVNGRVSDDVLNSIKGW
jgi:4-aminobutyrate aminotransferase